MTSLRHLPERRLHVGQAVRHLRQRVHHALGQQAAQAHQRALHGHVRQKVDRHKSVPDVRTLLRHASAAPNVALADLDEATAAAEHRQRTGHEAARGQAVQHDVDSAKRLRDLRHVVRVARTERVGNAHAAHQRALVRPAGRRNHDAAQRRSLLNRGEAHAAGRAVDQHALARTAAGSLAERRVNGDEHGRTGSRGLERQVRRHGRHARRSHLNVGTEAAASQAEHGIARTQRRHAAAARYNNARAVAAGGTGVAGVHAQDVEHVAEVDAHGANLQHDVPRSGRRVNRLRLKVAHRPARKGHQVVRSEASDLSSRCRGIQQRLEGHAIVHHRTIG